MNDIPPPDKIPYGLAVYLAVIQFFFVSMWTVYVVFLPQLAGSVGIPKEWVIWILMFDQAIFAVMDLVLGQAADRVERAFGRIGPAILTMSMISCAVFILLPFLMAPPHGGPVTALLLIGIWSATSSVLRAPPWVLLSRYAAKPKMPWLVALNLTGLGVAAGLAPYLGTFLRELDPRWPFAVSSLVLAATTLGLLAVERQLNMRGPAHAGVAEKIEATAIPKSQDRQVVIFFIACCLLGFGSQIHTALNSPLLYRKFAGPNDLEVLLPIFWIGFNLAMFPGAGLAERFGSMKVIAFGAVTGVAGSAVAAFAPSLEILISAQVIAGGAWGAMMTAGFSVAMRFGHQGREGLFLGLLWSALSISTLGRMALVAGRIPAIPEFRHGLIMAPAVLWFLAGMLLVLLLFHLKADRHGHGSELG